MKEAIQFMFGQNAPPHIILNKKAAVVMFHLTLSIPQIPVFITLRIYVVNTPLLCVYNIPPSTPSPLSGSPTKFVRERLDYVGVIYDPFPIEWFTNIVCSGETGLCWRDLRSCGVKPLNISY